MEKPLQLLIVDDDACDRMNLRQALRSFYRPIEYVEVSNCTAALEQTQKRQFDSIFLNYRLPDQDGLRLVKTLRDRGITIPLIVLTDSEEEQRAIESTTIGTTEYLPKAKVSSELPRLLQSAVRLYQAEQETERAYQRLHRINVILKAQNEKLKCQHRQIKLQNLQLLEASQLKSQFLATMSHELRTPLNAIIGFSQVLLRQHESNHTSWYTMIQRIFSNGKHLLDIINDILDLSKLETGCLNLNLKRFNLAPLVQETINELQALADAKHLPVRVNFHLSNPEVQNDPARLGQVLTNLLSNAIKFTEAGEVCLEISDVLPDQIAIEVRDTGIGIAPDALAHIFEPFRQVDQTITRKYAGTGLGLAITELLVQMMEGQITVKSQLGKGTSFRVVLPRQVEALTLPSILSSPTPQRVYGKLR